MKWEDNSVYDVASMYYLQGLTMETIARHFGVSRSSISRVLAQARDQGIVRVTLNTDPGKKSEIATEFERLLGINVSVVPVREGVTELTRLKEVSRVAAQKLIDLLEPGAILGIAWGTTVSEVVNYLPHTPIADSRVVQLNGAASPSSWGVPYAETIISQAAHALEARMIPFPVPAFFDFPQTRVALWQERSVRRVLAIIRKSTVAMFGVGAFNATVPSHVYAADYLSQDTMKDLLDDGVVGDVCTVLLREDGSYADVSLNDRASGPTPDQLKTIPRRLCVVSGVAKSVPLVAALRSGVVTDLVIDDLTAEAVLKRLLNPAKK